MTMIIRSYSEMLQYDSFEDRFRYLELDGEVCSETFGRDRYLNQKLYTLREWKDIRRKVILRDEGCDLAVPGFELKWKITVHHINPISIEDVLDRSSKLFDMENLVTVSYNTHKAIHYGKNFLKFPSIYEERKPNDTCPWKV